MKRSAYFPYLMKEEMRHREVQPFDPRHTTNERQSHSLNPGSMTLKSVLPSRGRSLFPGSGVPNHKPMPRVGARKWVSYGVCVGQTLPKPLPFLEGSGLGPRKTAHIGKLVCHSTLFFKPLKRDREMVIFAQLIWNVVIRTQQHG